MAETGEFAVMCPSDMIATVMQAYFNEVLFGIAVTITDAAPTEQGYVFTVNCAKPLMLVNSKKEVKKHNVRDTKGKFSAVTNNVALSENALRKD